MFFIFSRESCKDDRRQDACKDARRQDARKDDRRQDARKELLVSFFSRKTNMFSIFLEKVVKPISRDVGKNWHASNEIHL